MKNKNGNVSTYLSCDCNEAKKMQRNSTLMQQKVHNFSRLGRCKGLGAKVAPKVPLPLIFKN